MAAEAIDGEIKIVLVTIDGSYKHIEMIPEIVQGSSFFIPIELERSIIYRVRE